MTHRPAPATAKLLALATLLALAPACQQRAKVAPASSSGSSSAAGLASDSTHASTYHAPNSVVVTNQTEIWSCPNCEMDYDGPGQCAMCHVDLVHQKIAYICPADQKPVEHAGACPRCNAHAIIERTALTPQPPAPLTGN